MEVNIEFLIGFVSVTDVQIGRFKRSENEKISFGKRLGALWGPRRN